MDPGRGGPREGRTQGGADPGRFASRGFHVGGAVIPIRLCGNVKLQSTLTAKLQLLHAADIDFDFDTVLTEKKNAVNVKKVAVDVTNVKTH